ncbi:class I SAM-dependent methyltransferase [Actinokineospora cianjurensis]|uniref:Methyltransferase family protein n=1 Tax=Actinokineospora cianjurensis TaxID=585224 RepID=A0A421B103_9PSEU|nr:class I SAM-dependent methyltransferase [Actinokineospora cianjurensis]RLK57961.1 methyltransferase family protein [Actinokineospora cianjurensis]
MTSYVFDNADARAQARFDVLAAFDPASHFALTTAGLAPGWTCWEIGGGDGRVGHWMSDQVGPGGSVLVTDIDPRHIPTSDRPNLTVHQHDVVNDPLPAATFDLIHARLVLIHLPQRLAVLDRLITALKPGGRLVLEEFDLQHPLLPHTTTPEHRTTFTAVHAPLLHLYTTRDVSPTWARSLPELLIAKGLTNPQTHTTTHLLHGGTPQTTLHRVNTEQLTHPLIATGVTPKSLDAFYTLLDTPDFTIWSYPLVSALGTRPTW